MPGFDVCAQKLFGCWFVCFSLAFEISVIVSCFNACTCQRSLVKKFPSCEISLAPAHLTTSLTSHITHITHPSHFLHLTSHIDHITHISHHSLDTSHLTTSPTSHITHTAHISHHSHLTSHIGHIIHITHVWLTSLTFHVTHHSCLTPHITSHHITHFSLFVAGALFRDGGMSFLMANVALADVGASLFVARQGIKRGLLPNFKTTNLNYKPKHLQELGQWSQGPQLLHPWSRRWKTWLFF